MALPSRLRNEEQALLMQLDKADTDRTHPYWEGIVHVAALALVDAAIAVWHELYSGCESGLDSAFDHLVPGRERIE